MHIFGKLVHSFGELVYIFEELVHIFAPKLVSRTSKQVWRNLGPLWQPKVYNDTMVLSYPQAIVSRRAFQGKGFVESAQILGVAGNSPGMPFQPNFFTDRLKNTGDLLGLGNFPAN